MYEQLRGFAEENWVQFENWCAKNGYLKPDPAKLPSKELEEKGYAEGYTDGFDEGFKDCERYYQ